VAFEPDILVLHENRFDSDQLESTLEKLGLPSGVESVSSLGGLDQRASQSVPSLVLVQRSAKGFTLKETAELVRRKFPSVPLLAIDDDLRSEVVISPANQELSVEEEESPWYQLAHAVRREVGLAQRIGEFHSAQSDLESRLNRLQLLKKLLDELQQLQEMREVFQNIYDAFPRLLNIRRISLLLYDEKSQTLISDELIGLEHHGEELHSAPQLLGASISGKCFLENEPVVVNDCSESDLIPQKYVEELGLKSTLAVPLLGHYGPIGVLRIDDSEKTGRFARDDVDFFAMLGQTLGTAIENSRLYTETLEAKERLRELNESLEARVRRRTAELEKEIAERKTAQESSEQAYSRIKNDLATAARVQKSMLPEKAPALEGIEFAWIFDSCDEVAGDMFNIVRIDGSNAGIYLLDVAGHGVQAALLSVTVDRLLAGKSFGAGLLTRRSSRTPSYVITSPSSVAAQLNSRFPFSPATCQFFTFMYGLLNEESSDFVYTRAGQRGPLLVRDGEVRRLEGESGPAIGLIPNPHFQQEILRLQEGDRVIFHTDGVEEAFNEKGEMFGDERLMDAIRRHGNLSIQVIVQAVHEEVQRFSSGAEQADDITILGFSYR